MKILSLYVIIFQILFGTANSGKVSFEVSKIDGTTAISINGKSEALGIKTPLKTGSVIKTSDYSRAQLRYQDSLISLRKNTQIRIEKPNYLYFEEGAIAVDAKKGLTLLLYDSYVTVDKNSKFYLLQKNDSTEVTLLSGEISIVSRKHEAKHLKSSESIRLKKGVPDIFTNDVQSSEAKKSYDRISF